MSRLCDILSLILAITLPIQLIGEKQLQGAEDELRADAQETLAPIIGVQDFLDIRVDQDSPFELVNFQPPAASFVGEGAAASRQLSIRADYLHWWMKSSDLPALVTTSPSGTARSEAGVLGEAGTSILVGSEPLDRLGRPGVRVHAGAWSSNGEAALEASWFSLFDVGRASTFEIESAGSPTVTRPFLNVQTGLQASELTAFIDPGGTLIAAGDISVGLSSAAHSASVAVRRLYREGARGRMDLIGGYRYFRLREALDITETVTSHDPGSLIAVGTTFELRDRFATRNTFHGGELGTATTLTFGQADLEVLAKVAIGSIEQTIDIEGNATATLPPPSGAHAMSAGGLLTQPTNIGRRRRNEFAVLPELGVNLRVLMTERTTFTAGYTLLFLNHVARAGEQIDVGLNPSQFGGGMLMGSGRPTMLDANSDLWIQGVNVGLVIEH